MYIYHRLGEVAEWSNALVLKTSVLQGTGGSNPSFSAIKFPNVFNIDILGFLIFIFMRLLKGEIYKRTFCNFKIPTSKNPLN